MIQETLRRRPGPKPSGIVTRTFTVELDPDDGEWGKGEPEGLSALLRKLLRHERHVREAEKRFPREQ
jgi:hypothetical protein